MKIWFVSLLVMTNITDDCIVSKQFFRVNFKRIKPRLRLVGKSGSGFCRGFHLLKS